MEYYLELLKKYKEKYFIQYGIKLNLLRIIVFEDGSGCVKDDMDIHFTFKSIEEIENILK